MSGVSNTRRLRSLLTAAKKDQDLTLDEIVVKSEGRVRRSYAGNLLKEVFRKHPLTREELTDIAEAFGVDYEVLRQAHLTDMGLAPVEGTPDAAPMTFDLPRGVERLTARQRSALSVLIRAMVDPQDDNLPDEDVQAAETAKMTAEIDAVRAAKVNGKNGT